MTGEGSRGVTEDGRANKYLAIYLSDHMAGSVAGLELAKRSASSNRGTELGRYLDYTLIPEIKQDRGSLETIMNRLGISAGRFKQGIAWVGEKVGRLKLNGEVTTYSPLSRLVELEGLAMGVLGKRCGWQSLKTTHGADERLADIDFDLLIARADRQLAQLENHRRDAAVVAFR